MYKYSALFWKNVQIRLKSKDWAPSDLARESGLMPGTLSKLKSNKANPTLDTIGRIADGFKCEPWELLIDFVEDFKESLIASGRERAKKQISRIQEKERVALVAQVEASQKRIEFLEMELRFRQKLLKGMNKAIPNLREQLLNPDELASKDAFISDDVSKLLAAYKDAGLATKAFAMFVLTGDFSHLDSFQFLHQSAVALLPKLKRAP